MTLYASIADMTDRYRFEEMVERTNLDSSSATAIDSSVLNIAITDASSEMDTILQGRTPPTSAVSMCCSIARYRLYYDSSKGDGSDRPRWAIDYDNAISSLKIYAESVPKPQSGSLLPDRVFAVRTATREIDAGLY